MEDELDINPLKLNHQTIINIGGNGEAGITIVNPTNNGCIVPVTQTNCTISVEICPTTSGQLSCGGSACVCPTIACKHVPTNPTNPNGPV